MFLSPLRGIYQDKIRTELDLSNKATQLDPYDLDTNLVNDITANYDLAKNKLFHNGWIDLGHLVSMSDLNWVIRQNSWCILENPFQGYLRGFTRDQETAVKFKMRNRSIQNYSNWKEKIVQFNWRVVPIKRIVHDELLQIEKWLSTNCKDEYLICYDNVVTESNEEIYYRYRCIFTNVNDAVYFKMAGEF